MANITFRSSSVANSPSASTLAVTAPSGTAVGDLVVILAARNAGSSSADSIVDNNPGHAFTKDRSDWEASNGLSLVVFSKRIVGGDPGSYSFTFSGDVGATRFSLAALTFTSPDATTIYDVTPSASTESHKNNDNGTVDCVNVTSTRTGGIHILCATREGGIGAYDGTPSGYTLQCPAQAGSALNTVWYKVLGATGATGVQTVTASGGGLGATQTQSFILMNSAPPTDHPITAASGSLTLTGTATVLRVSAITYLRYRK